MKFPVGFCALVMDYDEIYSEEVIDEKFYIELFKNIKNFPVFVSIREVEKWRKNHGGVTFPDSAPGNGGK